MQLFVVSKVFNKLHRTYYCSIQLFLTTNLSLYLCVVCVCVCVLFHVCCQWKKQAMLDSNVKHCLTQSSASPPCRQSVRYIHSGCTCMSQTLPLTILPLPHPPLSLPLCVCVCACAHVHVGACAHKSTAAENLGKQFTKKFQHLENMLLLKAFGFNTMWRFRNAWGRLTPLTVGQSSTVVNTVSFVKSVTRSAREQQTFSHAQSRSYRYACVDTVFAHSALQAWLWCQDAFLQNVISKKVAPLFGKKKPD